MQRSDVAHPLVLARAGGSRRNEKVDAAAAEHGVTIVNTGIRLFHH
jgi:phosphoribosylaminoimidazolecarboxamide formyltransferase / IMP cyclohydrolase